MRWRLACALQVILFLVHFACCSFCHGFNSFKKQSMHLVTEHVSHVSNWWYWILRFLTMSLVQFCTIDFPVCQIIFFLCRKCGDRWRFYVFFCCCSFLLCIIYTISSLLRIFLNSDAIWMRNQPHNKWINSNPLNERICMPTKQAHTQIQLYHSHRIDGFISSPTDIFIGKTKMHEVRRLSPVCHVVTHHVTPNILDYNQPPFPLCLVKACTILEFTCIV